MTRTLCALVIATVAFTLAHATPPAVVVPGNGTGYDPQMKILAEIRDEVKGLRADLKALQSGGLAKPSAERKVAREQLMLRACSGCHTPGRVEDGKDGGLMLFDDDESKTLRRLSPRETGDVADWIKRGDMPKKPKPPLSVEERKLFE